MGEVQANTKPFLLVATTHWAVAQGGDRERSLKGEDQTLQHPGLGFWATAGGAVLSLHPQDTQWSSQEYWWNPESAQRWAVTGNDTPKCLCYMTRVLQSQRKIHLLKAGKNSGFFTMASIPFLQGMLRKTALHQMNSNSSCRKFIKRREIYEQGESAGKVFPTLRLPKHPLVMAADNSSSFYFMCGICIKNRHHFIFH